MPEPAPQPKSVLTVRGTAVGLVAVALVTMAGPYSEWVVRSSYMTTNYFPLGLAFLFILIALFLNPLLRRVGPRFALRGDDLGIVYTMLVVAVSVPTYGMVGYTISIVASPFYYATPENAWATYLHPHIPRWAVPGGGPEVAWFFEGLPPGESIPWRIWAGPLFWWGSLTAATLTLCVCLIATFRRPWVEQERLNFPVVTVPLAAMEGADEAGAWPRFARSPLFWAGFGAAAFKVLWNIPAYFNSGWPALPPIQLNIPGGKVFPGIRAVLSLPLLGVTYFANADVILSIWVFYLFHLTEIALFNRTGFSIGASEMHSITPAALAWQSFGAFAAIVLGGVWVARGHLREVFRKTFRGDEAVDDSREVLSYRAAALGLLGSAIYILFYLRALGIALPVAALLVYAVVTIFLGLTRAVIEGGLMFVLGPLVPQAFPAHVVGPAALSGDTMTGLALSYAWVCDPIVAFLPCGANAVKVHSERRFPRGTYLAAVGLALGVSLPLSFYFSLKLGYAFGSFNFGDFVFQFGGQVPYDTAIAKMKAGQGVTAGHPAFLGLGALVTLALIALRHRFAWWRLHPIGFAVASTSPVRWTVLSFFAVWLVKVAILRLGGMILFNRARPFFIGLVAGHFTGAGLSFVVDAIWFRGHGHVLYF
jgi:hypothetical protein